MKKCWLAAIAALLLSIISQSSALGAVGKKVALVIGNSAYLHSVALPNPVADSRLMAETLRSAGFSVIEGSNLGKGEMTKVLDQFTEAAYDAEIALVFYAGHGLQVDGRNYLIPVDAELQNAPQLQTRTIPVEAILAALPPDPAVGVVILDACRDNPLARTLAASLPRSRSSAVGTGLAVVQANEQTSMSGGLLIAYATDPGAVAYDGNDANSPYTTALAKHLAAPGVEIQSALTRVRAEVAGVTKGAQRPWHNASLAREVFIGVSVTVAEPAPIQEPVPGTTANSGTSEINWTVEQAVWEEASKRNTIAHYEFYISQYPQGRFVNLAHLNIRQLQESEGHLTEPERQLKVSEDGNPDSSSEPAVPSKIETASAGQADENVATSEDPPQVAGTPETEARLKWGKEEKIDLQLRLSALGLYTGDFDGSLGPRSRAAIGAWQRLRGIVETTYLTAEQHMLLVVQSDPMMTKVRAEYEAAKTAPEVAKPLPKTTGKSTKKRQQTVGEVKSVAREDPKANSKLPCKVYDISSQSFESCSTTGNNTKKRQQISGENKSAAKPKAKSKLPCQKYDINSQSFERCD